MKNGVLYDQEVTEIYDDWVGSGYYNYQQVTETLSKIIGKRKKVLELGIGTGNVAILLAQKGYQVTGIDPSPFMLAKLEEKLKKNRLGITWIQQQAEKLQVKGKFDAVFSYGAAFWVSEIQSKLYFDTYFKTRQDFEESIKRIYKILSQGGLLIMNIQHHGASFKLNLRNGLNYHFVIEKLDKNHIVKTHFFQNGEKPLFKKPYKMFRLSEKEAVAILEKAHFTNLGSNETKTFWVFKKR